jgi:hypothetical protein
MASTGTVPGLGMSRGSSERKSRVPMGKYEEMARDEGRSQQAPPGPTSQRPAASAASGRPVESTASYVKRGFPARKASMKDSPKKMDLTSASARISRLRPGSDDALRNRIRWEQSIPRVHRGSYTSWIPRRLTAPLRTHVYPILTLQQPSTRCLPYQPPNRTLGGSRQSLGAAFSRLSLVCHSRRFCEWALYVPTAYHQLIFDVFVSLSQGARLRVPDWDQPE